MNTIDIPKEWDQVAERIKQDTKLCVVIGKIDSGKSTLCKYLIHIWTASGIRVGHVDSDPGTIHLRAAATVSSKTSNTPSPLT